MGTDAGGLPALLASGEQAVFHGQPGQALAALSQAQVAAQEAGQPVVAAATAWLTGVALGALGRVAEAQEVLTVLARDRTDPQRRLLAAMAGATSASLLRQIGRHPEGRQADAQALELAAELGLGGAEAATDAQVGLVADAVGMGDAAGAGRALEAAQRFVAAHGDLGWRVRVRLSWVEAEVALLNGAPEAATTAAREALGRSERARAPRHVAKSLLFLGVAQASLGQDSAAATLRRAAALADGLGARPLSWPARAMLGAVLEPTRPAESVEQLNAARATVLSLAEDLGAADRDHWLARPDVAALVARGRPT